MQLIGRIAPALVDRERRSDAPRTARPARTGSRAPPRLGTPVLAVPGNHDIPYALPGRASPRPWQEFERAWETIEPTYNADGAARRRAQLGAALAPSVGRRRRGPPAPGCREAGRSRSRRAARRRPPPPAHRRAVALAEEARRAPRTTSSGPDRRGRRADPRRPHPPGLRRASATSSRSSDAGTRGGVVSIAPGLGQPRPHRRGEARGAMVYRSSGTHDHGRDVHLARGRLGAHGRSGPFRAAPAPRPTNRVH